MKEANNPKFTESLNALSSEVFYKVSFKVEPTTTFPVYLLNDSFTSDVSREILGGSLGVCVSKTKGPHIEIFFEKESLNAVASDLTKKLANVDSFDALKLEIQGQKNILKDFIKRSLAVDASSLTEEEIFSWFDEYTSLLGRFRVYAAIPNYLTFGEKPILDVYRNMLQEKLSEDEFATMTSPEGLSRTTLAERELLTFLKEDSVDDETISNWIHDNGYIYYYYTGPLPDIEMVKKMLQDLHETHKDPQRRINVIDGYVTDLKEKKEKIEKEHNINTEDRHLLEVLSYLGFYKAERKLLMQHSYVVLDPLLQNLAKHHNISLHDLKMFTLKEIREGILSSDSLADIASERRKHMLYISHKGSTTVISDKKKIENLCRDIQVHKDEGTPRITVASSGEAVEAKIYFVNSQNDLDKIKDLEGDFILGSISTYPDLLPAMSRAVGIITEIGGLTSHAAIVSREMKKPCIVGYKALSHDFKDGDTILLDTKNLIVKKIK